MTKREQFIQWLGDAHAMEVGIVGTLEKHIADAKGQPKVRAALTKHLRETKRHAELMKKALASMGGSHPYVKEGLSKIVNFAAGVVTTSATDTLVKNAIADFATEHFEIACYTSLIATATALGEPQIAGACRTILKEEKAMAKVLEGQMVEVNNRYLGTLDADESKAERPKAAKRSSPTKRKVPAKRTGKR